MQKTNFIHLRLHTEFSISDGLVRLDDAVEAALKDKQPAIAISDNSNLFGMVKFFEKVRRSGIKPIIGCDVWITNEENRENPFRALILVKDYQGYLNLCELLTRAWLTNQNGNRAEIRINWFNSNNRNKGLIVLSGFNYGDIGFQILRGKILSAERNAYRWKEIFSENFYIEIQRFGHKYEDKLISHSLQIASKLDIPVVATHPIQFLKKTEFYSHEARICIASGERLANSKREKKYSEEQYFKTQDEMFKLFFDMPEVLENTLLVAKRCNLKIEFGKPKLPDFPLPKNVTISEYLLHQSKLGLEKRLDELYASNENFDEIRKKYDLRLKYETETIIKMGFPGYFLIVADFIQWAKKNNIPVGPGRGSGAGSLVAYSLSITNIDPIKYNLLFERFLNPERISMPDFDIDFCQEGRDKVIQYVKERYGKQAVSQIVTFGTMAAKGAVRDVGRVLDYSYTFCDSISKLIPFKPGKQITISDAFKEDPTLNRRYEEEEEVKLLIELAKKVEGVTRNVSMHAGGVLIAPGKLTDFCPLYSQGNDNSVVSQFDKDDIETIGLVKFDFLGLTTLTIIDKSVSFMRNLNIKQKDFDINKIPLNDNQTYSLLSKGNTVGVFQLESKGMQNMLKEAKPDRFEDIIALVALYRPGPMELIPDFCRRKKGEKFNYPDPRTKTILEETYGIMVYQEQVMQIAQVIGGYTLGKADLLRRAMGKKKIEEMSQQREIFRDGASKNGLSKKKADEIFNLMEKFAGYGFNKSHAAAYAVLSYQTAFLKTHYPAVFMAANLSMAMDDTEKIKILVEDTINNCKIEILPPDINQSDYFFKPELNKISKKFQIRFGLGAIKGTGYSAIENILYARNIKNFENLFDLVKRVDRRIVNRRSIESLVKAGAFDCINSDRGNLFSSIGLAIDSAEQEEFFVNQTSLFEKNKIDYEEFKNKSLNSSWSKKRQLIEEKSSLGFFLSGHLFEIYSEEIDKFLKLRIKDISNIKKSTLISGIITSIRYQITSKGRVIIIKVDDNSSQIDVIINNEKFEKFKNLIIEDELIFIQVRVINFSGSMRIIGENFMNISSARGIFAKSLRLSIKNKIDINYLRELLKPYLQKKESCPIILEFYNQNTFGELRFSDEWKVRVDDKLFSKLSDFFSKENVRFEY